MEGQPKAIARRIPPPVADRLPDFGRPISTGPRSAFFQFYSQHEANELSALNARGASRLCVLRSASGEEPAPRSHAAVVLPVAGRAQREAAGGRRGRARVGRAQLAVAPCMCVPIRLVGFFDEVPLTLKVAAQLQRCPRPCALLRLALGRLRSSGPWGGREPAAAQRQER